LLHSRYFGLKRKSTLSPNRFANLCRPRRFKWNRRDIGNCANLVLK